ncbi:hypothetical protein KKH3_23860 [Pectobacterium actinidiae]|nr:hypothetical protein KKH3_23860 [Pectobacterium actinidiae]
MTVFCVIPVREIQAHNIHASRQQVAKHFFRLCFRPDGTNNFCLFHTIVSTSCDG